MLILTGEFLKQVLLHNCQENGVREAAQSKLPHATFKLTKVCFSSLSPKMPAAFLLPEGFFQAKLHNEIASSPTLKGCYMPGSPQESVCGLSCTHPVVSFFFVEASGVLTSKKGGTMAHSDAEIPCCCQEKASW